MLKVSQHELKSLRWWYGQFVSKKIDMTPPYQRRSSLWSQWKKAHLIDSILSEFDVPKFYVADFTTGKSQLNHRKVPYAIIDGKQRFEAIFDYMEDNFPLNQSIEVLDPIERPLAGLRYSQLRARYPAISDRLEKYQPIVMSVFATDQSFIEQMFIRLNSGEPINGAEKRNAMGGPIPPIMRDLTLHPFFQECIKFNTRRMGDLNLAAKLLLIEHRNGFVDTKAKNLDAFVREIGDEQTAAVRAAKKSKAAQQAAEDEIAAKYLPLGQKVLETLDVMFNAFEFKDKLLSQAGQIPVYFWILRNHPELASKLRKYAERLSKDVLDNVRLSRIDPESADQSLISYYEATRTTNDQGSLIRRYNFFAVGLGFERIAI